MGRISDIAVGCLDANPPLNLKRGKKVYPLIHNEGLSNSLQNKILLNMITASYKEMSSTQDFTLTFQLF